MVLILSPGGGSTMTIEAALREKSVDTQPAMKLAVTSAKAPDFVKGRRDFFKYRDLGVTKASSGWMRAQVTSAITGMTQPTGWLSCVRRPVRLHAERLGRAGIRGRHQLSARGR